MAEAVTGHSCRSTMSTPFASWKPSTTPRPVRRAENEARRLAPRPTVATWPIGASMPRAEKAAATSSRFHAR